MSQLGDIPESGSNTPLIVGTIIAIVVIVGAIVALIIVLVRQNAKPPAKTSTTPTNTAPTNTTPTNTKSSNATESSPAGATTTTDPDDDKLDTNIVTPADPKTGVAANTVNTDAPATPPVKCCWNRAIQGCSADSECDTGGEGCIASGTPTKQYGSFACNTCDMQGKIYNRGSDSCVDKPSIKKCTPCKLSGLYWCPPGALPAPYQGGNLQVSNFRSPQYDPENPHFTMDGVGYYFRQNAANCGSQ